LKLPKKSPPDLANALNRTANDRLYNSLAFLKHLLDQADPGHHWGQRLINHITTLQAGNVADMGFPPNWQNWKLWGGTQ